MTVLESCGGGESFICHALRSSKPADGSPHTCHSISLTSEPRNHGAWV